MTKFASKTDLVSSGPRWIGRAAAEFRHRVATVHVTSQGTTDTDRLVMRKG